MGKDYSTNTYKKTYGSEYIKTYKNYRNNKALFEERKKEYEKVSKKLDSKPYQQSEKTIIQTQTVGNPTSTLSPPKKQLTKSQTPPPFPKPIVETPPPYNPQSEFKQVDYSKIDINALKHPVISVGNGMYRNIYTGETVDEDGARNILEYARYKPKPLANMGLFFLFSLIVAFLFTGIGPLALIIWGWLSRNKYTTDYVKMIGTTTLVYPMPATDIERQAYKNRGNIYMGAGVIIGLIQIISSFY